MHIYKNISSKDGFHVKVDGQTQEIDKNSIKFKVTTGKQSIFLYKSLGYFGKTLIQTAIIMVLLHKFHI